MKVDLDASDTIAYITQELENLPKELEAQRGPILKKCSKIIKTNVENNLPRSDLGATATNYDGTPYIHMRDDVKITIKDDKAGNVYAVIHGGKKTGFKWHMLENGTSDTDAIHFIDKAMKQSDSEIDATVDEAIGRAVQGGD